MHKIKNKDEETSELEKKMKKKKKLKLLDSNPHLLSAITLDYPLGYLGIVNNFIQIQVIVQQSKTHFYEDSRRLSERSLNIHMFRVNFDKQ